jgi:hypothetical protein
MANRFEPSPFAGSALGPLPISSRAADWDSIDRKLAARWSTEHDGDIPGVLNAWRLAEHALAMAIESGSAHAELEAHVAALRAEYHRLFRAATGEASSVAPGRAS